MAAWRTLIAVLVCFSTVLKVEAQTYNLSESVQPGDCHRLHIEMTVSGEMRVLREGKTLPLKLEASASHEFPERVLELGAAGLPEKTARHYDKARAEIDVSGARSIRTLRTERLLCVAQRHKDTALVYAPGGPLTRQELELTGEHFDTLFLVGLLAGKAVPVGETWKVSNSVIQALCNFEGLTEQDVSCKLAEVKDQVACITMTGSATGIELGALCKVHIEASCLFDLPSSQLTRVEWKQKDERDQGPASPALSLESKTILTRAVIDKPDCLADGALASVPDGFEPPGTLTQLEYHDPKGRFDTVFPREWQTVSQTEDHLVLRLIERGDLVAQMTITPWTKAEKGKHLSTEEFAQAMGSTPGWEPMQELQAGEVAADRGRWIYRISDLGQLDGQKVMQNFYLVAGPGGDQVVLVLTMTPKEADRLGTRDLSLAANIDFPTKQK